MKCTLTTKGRSVNLKSASYKVISIPHVNRVLKILFSQIVLWTTKIKNIVVSVMFDGPVFAEIICYHLFPFIELRMEQGMSQSSKNPIKEQITAQGHKHDQ